MNSQSCPESLRSARSYHWEWCTINNELRTTSCRRVLGGRPRQSMGPCNSGYWASPSASPVGVNDRRRCVHIQGRVPGGACSFPISVRSGTACLLNRLTRLARSCALLVPGVGKIHGQLLWSQEVATKVAGRLGGALRHEYRFSDTTDGRRQRFALCWGRFLLNSENRGPNWHSLTSNTPTNSPDQLGTVILLIMKFSTPDFGPRV